MRFAGEINQWAMFARCYRKGESPVKKNESGCAMTAEKKHSKPDKKTIAMWRKAIAEHDDLGFLPDTEIARQMTVEYPSDWPCTKFLVARVRRELGIDPCDMRVLQPYSELSPLLNGWQR